MLADFHFLRPAWLWLLLPLATLLWILVRQHGEGNAWRRVVDAHLLPTLLVGPAGGVARLPFLLLGSGWLLLVVALAGPTWSRLPQPVYQAQQFRVIALDLSPSMNANDLQPSRLTHARFEVLDLLRKGQEGQTALLAYGAEPFIVSPLTTDVATIEAQVPSLQTALLPLQGPRRTELVIDEAGQLLSQAGAPHGQIILVTDGLEHPAAASEAARRVAANGYRVSVLGVGTAEGGPVPLGDGGYLKDRSGAIVVPKLDATALQTLAEAGDGDYVTAAAGSRDIEALLPSLRGAAVTQQGQDADAESAQWLEQGPWLLLVLLPLAALAFRRGWCSPLLLVLVVFPQTDAHALTWQDLWLRADQQAMRSLEAGEAARAAELFTRPDWQAAADYEAGNYQGALAALEQQTGTEAAYNRGNALARSGRLEEAVAAYDAVLDVDPQNADARHNRDLLERLLEQRRMQQQKQQPQDQREDQQEQQMQAGGQDQQDQEGRTGESSGQQQQDTADPSQGSAGDDQQQQTGESRQSAGQDQAQNPSGQDAQSAADASAPAADQTQSGDASDQASSQPDGAEQQTQTGDIADNQVPTSDGDQQGKQRDAVAQGEPADKQDMSSKRSESEGPAKGDQPADAGPSQPAAGQGEPDDLTAGTQGVEQRRAESSPAGMDERALRQGGQPGIGDLMGGAPASRETASPATAGDAPVGGIDAESNQAMEQMLRRVEDDPAGLLRQRFLLQHLRRRGQL